MTTFIFTIVFFTIGLMRFHLGKPIFAMAILSVCCGGWLAVHRDRSGEQTAIWVFDPIQQQDYQSITDSQKWDGPIAVELVPARSLDMRLPMLFMSPGSSREMPDAVEIPIGSVGLYLRPPVSEVGFLPLNHYLQASGFREIDSLDSPGQPGWNARYTADQRIYSYDAEGWRFNPSRQHADAWADRILPSRLASFTKDGQIFGVPHDVHPVALAFRDDLFREANLPLIDEAGRPTVRTWLQFQDICLRFQNYWRHRGFANRHAIELPQSNSGMLSILLAQRHIELVNADDSTNINDPKVAETLAFYTGMVIGDSSIAGETSPDTALEFKDFLDGNLCAVFMPDWKVNQFRQYAPDLAAKMKLMPLPRFDPSNAPTASYGGTLIGIPRGSAHPDHAWRLIESLYFSPAGLAGRARYGILPPLPEEWQKPQYHMPDPYFGGQRTMEIYADLAMQVPPTRATPGNAIAMLMLSYIQSQAIEYARNHGSTGLEQKCQKLLDEAAIDLKRRIQHMTYEQ